MMLLDDKVALVTGGARGIGRSICKTLAVHGARIVVFDKDGETAGETAIGLAGNDHLAAEGDISSQEDRKGVVEQTVAKYGKIDILVNNAGVQYHSPMEEMDEGEWRHLFDVNVHGMMGMTRDIGKEMLAAGHGSIINIGSISSVLAMPRRGAYVTTKTAVVGLTRTVGVEWAQRGVRCNSIGPGYHLTPLLKEYIDSGKIDQDRIRRRIPMGRLGDLDEIGKVVVFLASDLASYVTGQHLMVDGGYTIFGAPEDASV